MTLDRMRRVARAEVAKSTSRGGERRWLVIAVVLGALSGIGMVALAHQKFVRDLTGVNVAVVVGVSQLVVLMVLALASSNFVTREIQDGTMITSKLLVPDTRSLFIGRIVGWFVVAVAAAGVATLVPLAAALADPAVAKAGLGLAAVQTGIYFLLSGLVSVLVYAGALVLKKGAFVVAVGLTLFFLVPMALTLLAAAVPPLTAAMPKLLALTLSGVIVGASNVPTSAAGLGAFATAWVMLLVWVGGTVALGYRTFASEKFAQS